MELNRMLLRPCLTVSFRILFFKKKNAVLAKLHFFLEYTKSLSSDCSSQWSFCRSLIMFETKIKSAKDECGDIANVNYIQESGRIRCDVIIWTKIWFLMKPSDQKE